MSKFSVATAFSSGVGLIERIPWTIVVWGVVGLVLQLLPRLVMWVINGHGDLSTLNLTGPAPGVDAMPTPAVAAPENAAAAGNLALQRLGSVWQQVVLYAAWGFAVSAIMNSAVYRAMLEPANRGVAYLGLGLAEFWQWILLIAQFLLGICFAVVVITVVIVAGMALSAVPGVWGRVLPILVILLFVGLALGVLIRFSLAGPMTFAARGFRLFESWGLTKNNGWGVFWTKYLAVALAIGVELISLYVVILPLSVMTATFKIAHADAAAADPMASPVTLAIGLVVLLAISILTAGVRAVMLAPGATIYSSLKA